MKALSVRQCWAWAIVQGYKLVENRTWATEYRGLIAIHASLSNEDMASSSHVLREHGIVHPADPPRGCIVGTVRLKGICRRKELPALGLVAPEYSNFATGPYCWILDTPRILVSPIELQGRQRLFKIEPAALEILHNSQFIIEGGPS